MDVRSMPASWLGARYALEPALIDVMRRDGELIAFREPGSTEWLYPTWQFENGQPHRSIPRLVRAAREARIGESRLHEILNARRGLNGYGYVYELLFEGRDDDVVELVRAG
jgi:hypothetical protein